MHHSNRVHGVLAMFVAVVMVGTTVSAAERPEQSKRGVSFRLASATAADGFTSMTAPDGSTVYVSTREVFATGEVLSMRAGKQGEHEMLEMSLSPKAVDLLNSSMKSGSTTKIAIVAGKKLLGVGDVASVNGATARVTGLEVGTASRIGRIVKTPATPEASAVVSVVPRQTTGKPNDVLTFDIFVSGVTGLKTYQFALDATGGDRGRLIRSGGSVDRERPDFLFGSRQAVAAVDNLKGRLGCVVIQGTADATSPKYVGTYTFLASEDASGDFTVRVRTNSDSFVAGERAGDLPYRAVGATVKISQ